MGAVVGTFAAVAGTLAAYKFFNIQVGTKFRKFVIAAMFGFVAVSLFDFVLSFFKADIGINGFGGIGLLMSVVGLGLGVLMLILDFDFVERGIAARLPGAGVVARGLRPDRHDHLDLHRAAADPRDPARQRLTA